MIAAALACLLSCACLMLAVQRWRALGRAGTATIASARGQSARSRVEQRAVALLGRDAGAELVVAVLEAPSRAHAVAELNEHLSDAAAGIETGATVPRSAARVALASGTLLSLVQIARELPAAHASATWPLVAFGSGLIAALGCGQLGRLADRRAQDLRRDWNDLARALRAHFPAADGSTDPGAASGQTSAIPDR